MKKTLSFLFAIIFSTNLFAGEHFEFMGIPINGVISEFQKHLTEKGWKIDKVTSSTSEVGSRWFDGTFFGEKTRLLVEYCPKSKVVYRCKAIIISSDFQYIKKVSNNIALALKEKYKNATFVPADKSKNTDEASCLGDFVIKDLGAIGVCIQSDMEDYFLIISYHDIENTKKMLEEKSADL